MTREVSNSNDIIDSREVIERIEEIEAELQEVHAQLVEDAGATEDFEAFLEGGGFDVGQKGDHQGCEWMALADELKVLRSLAEEGAYCASDWKHGAALIRDSYFEDHARELAEDIGAVKGEGWPNHCIDWAKAADELKVDYSSVDFDGVTYWVRS